MDPILWLLVGMGCERGRRGQKEKDCDIEARALLRGTRQEKERKKERVKVMIDLLHERLGSAPAGQRQSEKWA